METYLNQGLPEVHMFLLLPRGTDSLPATVDTKMKVCS